MFRICTTGSEREDRICTIALKQTDLDVKMTLIIVADSMTEIVGSFYTYRYYVNSVLTPLGKRVVDLRSHGALSTQVLYRLRQYFRIKNIYNSNAIEGNVLTIGETRLVVEMGMTIAGKPLRDQAEAKNLSEAVDFLEDLAVDNTKPITEFDVRQIHTLILRGIDDSNAGGYRKVLVEISGSDFKPPSPESVPTKMEEFGKWLATASVPGERFAKLDALILAAVAHTWLVYIHPFVDGNGRVARLLMNLILMRYGFPLAVITKEDRLRYYDALEQSQSSDMTPFLALLGECIEESLEEYESASQEQREQEEWARSLASKFDQHELTIVKNQYEIWKNAMELLKSYMRQTANMIDESAALANVYFKDFGLLTFEKYLGLRQGVSAKKTWFFRVDFRRAERTARYLFFFEHRSPKLSGKCHVTLHVSREEPPGSFYYERLQLITAPNVPNLVEIGYDIKGEKFVSRAPNDTVTSGKIEEIGKRFFEDVIRMHFST